MNTEMREIMESNYREAVKNNKVAVKKALKKQKREEVIMFVIATISILLGTLAIIIF